MSDHKVSSTSVSTMLSLMPSLSCFLLVLPNLGNLSPSWDRRVSGDVSLGPPPLDLVTLSCSFKLPHSISCNLGLVPMGDSHCCFGMPPSATAPMGLPCLKGNKGLFGEQSLNFACKRWRLLLPNVVRSGFAFAVGHSANLGEQDPQQDGVSRQPGLELG